MISFIKLLRQALINIYVSCWIVLLKRFHCFNAVTLPWLHPCALWRCKPWLLRNYTEHAERETRFSFSGQQTRYRAQLVICNSHVLFSTFVSEKIYLVEIGFHHFSHVLQEYNFGELFWNLNTMLYVECIRDVT